MKTLNQLKESFSNNDDQGRKFSTLIRAGLFDPQKLPLLKRALNKDVSKMNPQERNVLVGLLDKLMTQVVGNQQVYQKVRQNVMTTEGFIRGRSLRGIGSTYSNVQKDMKKNPPKSFLDIRADELKKKIADQKKNKSIKEEIKPKRKFSSFRVQGDYGVHADEYETHNIKASSQEHAIRAGIKKFKKGGNWDRMGKHNVSATELKKEENIQELSKKTLVSYSDKALKDLDNRLRTQDDMKKLEKRARGIGFAAMKFQEKKVNEAIEDKPNIPVVLVLKRRALRVYPEGQLVALYYADKIDKYVTIPFTQIGVSGEVSEETINELSKNKLEKYVSKASKTFNDVNDKTNEKKNWHGATRGSASRNPKMRAYHNRLAYQKDNARLKSREKGIVTALSKLRKKDNEKS